MKLDPTTGKPYGKPLTKQQEELERLRPKSGRERLLELLALKED